ncbi:hypothetical protein N9U60_01455 [Betaproteobacteria bacterium]|nr:hypothetical protein [Betaproteobacteria bacterium]
MKITVYSSFFSLVIIGICQLFFINAVAAQKEPINTKKHNTGLNPKAEITEPEKLLFLQNHLGNLPTSKVLTYRFLGEGETVKIKSKKIELSFKKSKNGILVTGFTEVGKTKKPIKKIANAISNPIILEFLEADIVEMQKLTKGQPNYFRKRIRAALAEGPEIFREKQIFKDEPIEVLAFSIEPYAKDPLRFESGRSKYRRYSKKKYTFYLSEKIPGHILGIDYEIPKRKKKGAAQEYYGKQQMRLE